MTVRFHPDVVPLLVDITTVTQYPDNPRVGDVESIVESIRVNGMYQPVVVQRSTGHVLAGNHRLAALERLGESRIPVVWVDVDDDQARRIALVDNRTSDMARYDDAALLDLLQTFGQDPAALLGTGYDPQDVDDLVLLLSRSEVTDLDELGDQLGEPTEEDRWVTVAFKVPPELADRWRAYVEGHDGDHVVALTALLQVTV